MTDNLATNLSALKENRGAIISKYAVRSNARAFWQMTTTTIPYFVLFYFAIKSLVISYWLSAALIFILILFLMRVFMMMHDCGHECVFKTSALNKIFGFFMGVFCGIPQYVWSKHHAYHHSTNGNWNKYRGPLAVLSTEEYSKLSPKRQRSYKNSRNILLAPFGGFMYFIFNPRFTWIKGSIDFVVYFIMAKLKSKTIPTKEIVDEFKTNYWATWKEYWHMTANNLVLITSWVLAGWYFGWVEFFSVYVIAISLSGALGIILFTIQHNFEGSYATGDKNWDYYTACLAGTSYLDLPNILHWFTADIGYHHVHHLSARIPNYRLVECHTEYAHLFKTVKRIKLSNVVEAFRYILWDNINEKIISVQQYEKGLAS